MKNIGWARQICAGVLVLLVSSSCATGATDDVPIFAMSVSQLFEDENVRRLARAAERGDLDEMEELVNSGVDVNARGAWGVTPLFWPMQRKNIRGFEKLLQLGADPDVFWEASDFVTALSTRLEDTRYLELCIQYGGNINLEYDGKYGFVSPLFSAVSSTQNTPRTLEILIDNGVDLSRLFPNGDTAIISAAIQDRYDHVDVLINAGVDYRAKNMYGNNVVYVIEALLPHRYTTQHQLEMKRKVIDFLVAEGVTDSGIYARLRETGHPRVVWENPGPALQ